MESALSQLSVTEQPVILLGSGGMLHRAWAESLDRRHIPHLDPGLDQLDLTRPQTIAPLIRPGCPLVINCAAYTDVDGAETACDLACQINGWGVGTLADCCRQVGAVFVHYSTDYVFDGDSAQPWPVDARCNPINAYGRSKLLGETLIRGANPQHLIIRTSWMYAPWGKNFVRTIADLAAQRETLSVVDDQRGRPTSAQHLAAVSLRLYSSRARGTWHVTDGGSCTWFELAREVVRLACLGTRVQPIRTADCQRSARRPANSVLDLSSTEALLGPMPPWQKNLAAAMRHFPPPPSPPRPVVQVLTAPPADRGGASGPRPAADAVATP